MKKETTTPPTKQSYVEPVDTKTTNGKWEVDDTSVNGISIWANEERDNGILIASVWREARGEEAEANAKLISQSKELAKALQDMIDVFGGKNPLNFDKRDDVLANAKQVLKKALG